MKFFNGVILKGSIPVLNVWLFASFPILSLYAHNADQVVLKQLVLPAILSITLSSFIFGLWLIILKNFLQASLAMVVLLVIFWNYGLFYMVFAKVPYIKHWHLVPLLFFIYFHLVYFISKIKQQKTLNNLNTILLVPIALLTIFNIITIFPAELNKVKTLQNNPVANHLEYAPRAGQHYPDVVLIILDEYASLKTIKEEWGYDNSAFADFLRDKGFFVTENSEARYNQTTWNISSLLNLDYLTGPVERSTFSDFIYIPESLKGTEEYNMLAKISFDVQMGTISNNFLTKYFKEHGYKIAVLEGISQHYSQFNVQNADITFSYQNVNKSDKYGFLANAFYMELIRKSMIYAFNMFVKIDNINYAGTRYVFKYLKTEFSNLESPKFIYAHIMCPHNPYVFDREGNYIKPLYAEVEGKFVPAINKVNPAYLEQYIYANNEIKSIVNSLVQSKSSNDLVFIIQSDHGPRPHELFLKDRKNSFKVFNAVYFPERDYSKMYDSIAPVNTLRVVLNTYFGENYKMLEDK